MLAKKDTSYPTDAGAGRKGERLLGDGRKVDGEEKVHARSAVNLDARSRDYRGSSGPASPSNLASSQQLVLEELGGDAAEAFGVDLLPQGGTPSKQYYRDRHSYVITVDREDELIQS